MKKIHVGLSLIAFFSASVLAFWATRGSLRTPNYSEGIAYALEQMRHIRMPDGTACIGSSARPLGRQPHQFFLLTRYLSASVSPPDLELMSKDKCPAVRIAAAEIILWDNPLGVSRPAIDRLMNDPEVVTFLDDCIPLRTTVGKVVTHLRTNRQLFFRERP